MTTDRELSLEEVPDAAAIQNAIDALERGGRLILPEMELTLDRGLELHSGVELVGQGEGTILRKGPGRVYPLSGYHNYGMCDVPLVSAAGLAVGMTVSVLDDERLGFYETFARISWIDGHWVGLDRGIAADYLAECQPRLTTAYPMIFGHGIADVAVRDLALEGNSRLQEVPMGACRGAAVYFARSRKIEVTGVRERDYRGEGIGFQMCRDVIIRECRVSGNAGNGLHPGAGSTNCLLEANTSTGNGKSGFFFCVRATRITVRGCRFEGNGDGVSIGSRDCHNLIESCALVGNRGAGLIVREAPAPVEVHSCEVAGCEIAANGIAAGDPQVSIPAGAHDLILRANRIAGAGRTAGIVAAPGARNLYLRDNQFAGCSEDAVVDGASLAPAPPAFVRGFGDHPDEAFRHLP